MGIFDWFRGAGTVLDHVQALAQTKDRLPLHTYDMVRRCHLLAHNNTDASTSSVTGWVGLVLVLAHRSILCLLLALCLSGG